MGVGWVLLKSLLKVGHTMGGLNRIKKFIFPWRVTGDNLIKKSFSGAVDA